MSQTDGEPLPSFAQVTGDPGAYVPLLKTFLASRNIELSYANAKLGAAHGASLKGRILLRDDLSAAVTFSVLVHEVAHELLHSGDRRAAASKTVRETEAEAPSRLSSPTRSVSTQARRRATTSSSMPATRRLCWRRSVPFNTQRRRF